MPAEAVRGPPRGEAPEEPGAEGKGRGPSSAEPLWPSCRSAAGSLRPSSRAPCPALTPAARPLAHWRGRRKLEAEPGAAGGGGAALPLPSPARSAAPAAETAAQQAVRGRPRGEAPPGWRGRESSQTPCMPLLLAQKWNRGCLLYKTPPPVASLHPAAARSAWRPAAPATEVRRSCRGRWAQVLTAHPRLTTQSGWPPSMDFIRQEEEKHAGYVGWPASKACGHAPVLSRGAPGRPASDHQAPLALRHPSATSPAPARPALPRRPAARRRLVAGAEGAAIRALGEHLWDEHKMRRAEERQEARLEETGTGACRSRVLLQFSPPFSGLQEHGPTRSSRPLAHPTHCRSPRASRRPTPLAPPSARPPPARHSPGSTASGNGA